MKPTQQELQDKFYYLDGNLYSRKTNKQAGADDNGYRRISVNDSLHYEHQLVWTYCTGQILKSENKEEMLDHIDQNRSNNCMTNLRRTNEVLNALNSKTYSNNQTGVANVGKYKGRYRVRIRHQGSSVFEKCYDTLEEATEVQAIESKKHFNKLQDQFNV